MSGNRSPAKAQSMILSNRSLFTLTLAAIYMTAASIADAQTPATGTGIRINNLKVLSDKIDDTTTPENILKSFVKPGMTDEQRAKALWTAAVKYRHQTAPPNEFLSAEWETQDPVKIFN